MRGGEVVSKEPVSRPILFSAPMVRAILDGRKTQTRRAIRPQPNGKLLGVLDRDRGPRYWFAAGPADRSSVEVYCPYGKPGDLLWVRETWQHSNHPLGPYDRDCTVFYRADYLDDPHGPDGEKSPEGKYRQWRPSIHMPRLACRITLRVTDVRVERLADISEDDVVAEGWPHTDTNGAGVPLRDAYPIGWYANLWEDINGKGSWERNPWVWVVSFERVVEARAAA